MLRPLLIAAICLPATALSQSFPTKFPAAGSLPAGAQPAAAPSAAKFSAATPAASARPTDAADRPPTIINSPYRVAPTQLTSQPEAASAPARASTRPVSGANHQLRRALPPLKARSNQPGNARPPVPVGEESVRLRPVPLREASTREPRAP